MKFMSRMFLKRKLAPRNGEYHFENGKLSFEGMTEQQRSEAAKKFVDENQLLEVEPFGPPFNPPWIEFPGYQQFSMGFRMGPGEDYNHQFQNWYYSVSKSEIDEFKKSFPEPEHYPGFYERLDDWRKKRRHD